MTTRGWIYNLVADFFLGLGAFSHLFMVVVSVLFLLFNARVLFPHLFKKNYLENEQAVLLINSIFFLLLRLPSLLSNEIDSDESEWIAGAATLIHDPRFWLSVDGTTSGPLNIFPLFIPHLLGWQLSFASVRLFLILFIEIPTFYCLYHSVKKMTVSWSAQGFLFLWIFFNAFMSIPSFFNPEGFFTFVFGSFFIYQSEKIPVLIISIIVLMVISWLKGESNRPARLFPAFFLIGLLPYAKIQSLYIAFLLGMVMLVSLWWSRHSLLQKFLYSTGFAFFALLPSLLCLIYLFRSGAWEDFFQSYILNNVVYSSTTNQSKIILHPVFDKYIYNPFARTIIKALPLPQLLFLYGILLSTVTMAIKCFQYWKKWESKNRLFFAFLMLWWVVSFLTIVQSHRPFLHYYNFFLPPLFVSLSFFFHKVNLLGVSTLTFPSAKKMAPALVFIVLVSLPYLFWENKFIHGLKTTGKLPISVINKDIFKYRKDALDRLAVYSWHNDAWGSHNKYYVETNLIQATRESHSERQLVSNKFSGKQFKYYRNRYLSDLHQNQPIFFIDMENEGSKTFPELKNYLDSGFVKYKSYHLDNFEKDSSSLYLAKRRFIQTN